MSGKSFKKAIVTGATGFIGSHLVHRLVAYGWEVHIITRKSSDNNLIESIKGRVFDHCHNGTTEDLLKIVDKVKPEVVFHLASHVLVQHSSDDIESIICSNVLFSTQLVEAMTVCGVTCLINSGTSWQHYENKDYCPVNLYAATKQAFESILKYYLDTTELRVITLKIFDTYGQNDNRQKILALLRRSAMEQKAISMTAGEQLIDLVYVDDVVDVFILASERITAGAVEKYEEFAVSSGHPVKLKEIANIFCKVIGKPLLIEWGGRPYRPREVMIPWTSGTPFPGWRPKVGLEEGIKRLFKD